MLGRPVDLYHIPGIVKSCSTCLDAMDQAGWIKQCTQPTTPELNVVTDVLIWVVSLKVSDSWSHLDAHSFSIQEMQPFLAVWIFVDRAT